MQRLRLDRQRVCWRRSTLRLYGVGVGCFFVETIAIVDIEGYLCREQNKEEL